MAKKNEKSCDRLHQYNLSQFKTTQELLSKKNNFFYFSIVLVSIVMLAVGWIIESNTQGVATKVFDGFDVRFLLLILLTMLFIAMLYVVNDMVVVVRKVKSRKFVSVVLATLTQAYYNLFQIWGKNSSGVSVEYLKTSGIDEDFSKKMTATKSISARISMVIYSTIVVIIGSIFAIKTINVLLYILAILSLCVLLSIVLLVVYFDKFKNKYLLIIGKFCKFLYKCKLIKDYELLYNNLVSKVMYYGTAIKFDKLYLIVELMCGVFARFLKHILLFLILCSFNIGGLSIFVEVLFRCTILDLVIMIIPIPNGVLLYELLFLALFRSIFVSGYVLYGMVGYRIATYVAIAIIFAIGYFVGIRKRIKEINSQNSIKTTE